MTSQYVRHKTNPSVYGIVATGDEGMLFHQWKWPKSQPPRKESDPPRSTSVGVTTKPVDKSIWNSFESISMKEFCEIEAMDMVRS